MECTLATLIACFSWSGLYVDTGISYHDYGEDLTYQLEQEFILVNEQATVLDYGNESTTVTWQNRKNPYGLFSLGYEIDFGSVAVSLEGRHTSSLSSARDRGVNSVSLTMKWRPFAAR